MDIDEVSRWLNRDGLSAAPCAWLRAVSIFVDEDYENYDYDVIGPRARSRISRVLEQHGFRQLTGREFMGPLGRIEFPRPNRTLSSDPVAELELVLQRGAGAVFATPTQILLATWRRDGPELSAGRGSDLVALVREQPANLDKVRDWLRRTESEPDFKRLRPQLASAQEEGFEQRRKGIFHSRLPR